MIHKRLQHLARWAALLTAMGPAFMAAPIGSDASRQTTPPREFVVEAFGARADVAVDSGPGIRAAIAAAIASGGPSRVVLGPGVYRVGRLTGDDYAISIRQADGLIVGGSGEDTEIVVTDPELGAFRFSHCRKTTLRDVVIDYAPLPYSQGTVTAVDLQGQTFDLSGDGIGLEPGHPAFAEAKAAWGLVVRPGRDARPTRFGPTAIPAVLDQELGPGNWRLHIGGPSTGYPDPLRTSRLAPGDHFVHLARNYTAGVWADHCTDFLAQGVMLYASPGLAFCPYLCEAPVLRDCHVRRRPGTGRLLSTNADGVHCRGVRRGITVTDCTFEGMADDAINVHSSPMPVLEVVSATELILQRSHYTLRVGDRVEAMNAAEAGVRGQAAILRVEEFPERWAARVVLDCPIPGLRPGAGFEHADNLYNLSEAGEGTVVTRCQFNSFRGRGVLLSCVGATVSANEFNVNEGWGICLMHESTRWGEGPLARNIRITENLFRGHGGYQAAIYARPNRRDGSLADVRVMREILIQTNRFVDLGTPAIELHSCRDVQIVNNVITTADEVHRPRPRYAAIVLDNCGRTEVSGLSVSDASPAQEAAIEVSATCETGADGVTIADLDTALAPDSVPVRDMRP